MAKTSLAKKEERILTGEFWTAKQRQAHSLHYAVSYRAAFKPELPQFFIREFLPKKKSTVMDPFGGRGTTSIQANLDGHFAVHNDLNPMAVFLGRSRQVIPRIEESEKLLSSLDLKKRCAEEEKDRGLRAFFHKNTLNEIKNLRRYFQNDDSPVMKYVMLTALSRLHGHSKGFFSVYTFPQISISPESQKRNNIKRNQTPDYREIVPRILKKMKTDLSDPLPPFYHEFSKENQYVNFSSDSISAVKSGSVDLIVTSPPFLDKVNYAADNWMKLWFLGIPDEEAASLSILPTIDAWSKFIHGTLREASRVLKKKANIVMEVGDVDYHGKLVNLDEIVINMSRDTGLHWTRTYINSQKFTKLSNCWNISNNEKGTNSNRCVVLQKG